MLSGDNGLLKRVGDARDDTIVGQEKESVELAYVSAAVKKLGSNVDKDDLQDELDISVGANKTTVTGSGTLKVKFEDTKNEYTVSQNGTVAKYEIIEPTDVYATVCANGTLLFSNNQSDINTYLSNNSTIIASGYEIKNIKDDIYYWNSDEDFKMPFWLDDNYSNIIKADILNTIVPKKTNIWFSNLSNLNTIEHLNNLNTSCTTEMIYMFAGCSNLTSIDVSNFDTNNVTNLQGMFHNCSNLTSINLSSFNTSNVNNMAEMFYGCSGLTNLNISNFNTSNVTDMSNMFYLCSSLTNIELSNFDTKNVTNMAQMFGETKFTTLDLTNFDTNKLTTAYGMFYNCSDLRTIYTTTSFVVSGLR